MPQGWNMVGPSLFLTKPQDAHVLLSQAEKKEMKSCASSREVDIQPSLSARSQTEKGKHLSPEDELSKQELRCTNFACRQRSQGMGMAYHD
ncbi:hypothetical protein A4A49_00041 [Nicotiana attenuata]|uniref:Uncharacterized protein n=1 Tax=Nicotiana attenuata TaxID=49451 RepID=A0A1J6J675_NICAT|nr:hypothetical protein A4A49_00041 [Nicotiana attenuata]